MQIDINKIVVGKRIRKQLGDIEELAQDIKSNGLINPPVITPDNQLIAGERRLQALKELGYEQIEVRVMSVDDLEHKLNLEINENENRKDFTKSERIEYARQLEKIERLKAEKREKAGKHINPSQNFVQGKTDDIVAKKLDIGSGEQYRKEKYIADNADPETFKQWDSEEISTHKAYQKIKDLQNKINQKDLELEDYKNSNARLTNELEKERDKETQVIEKEVVIEVEPDDYKMVLLDLDTTYKRLNEAEETLKKLQKDNEDLKNKLLIESNKKKEAISQLAGEQQKEELIREINGFAWTINGFIKDVGGLIYLTEYLNEVPPSSKKLFISSAETLEQWAKQLAYNIKDKE